MEKRKKRDYLMAYLLLFPGLLLFGIFTLYPIVNGIIISFFNWDGFGERTFVGFDNYLRAINDQHFINAFGRNVQYAIGTVTGKVAISLAAALLLNRKFRGVTFFRATYFVPVVLSFVAIGAMW